MQEGKKVDILLSLVSVSREVCVYGLIRVVCVL